MQNTESAEYLRMVFPEEIREQLVALDQLNPLPFIVINEDMELVYANNIFLSLGGFRFEEINGKDFSEIFVYPAEIPTDSEFFREDETTTVKAELQVDERNSLACVLNTKEVRSGKRTYQLVFIREIINPPETPEEREISEFYNFLESIGRFGSWEADLHNRIFYGSRLSYELLGMKNTGRKSDLGIVLDHIGIKEERENIEKSLYALQKQNERFEGEFRIRIKKDHEKEIRNIRIVCARKNQQDKRIFGFFEDITNSRNIEKELFRAKSKAEKADRFKSAFLKNLSHEIRTPMNAILGFTELLKPGDFDRENSNEYIGIIRKKANYLLSLIDDIIELSHFETGEVKFNKSEFELSPLLKELYDEFEEQRKEQNKYNIDLVLNIPQELKDIKIYSDPGRIHQLLHNLLSNAMKFTEKGQIEMGFKESAKHYKFYVSDTGIGLNEEEQKQVFNRFAEKEETLMGRFGGTGLSLTISRLIVEHLGGRIKVKSEPAKGSRFQINIPVEKPPKTEKTMANELENIKEQDWKDKVILVAEDEEVNFRFLEALLQKTQAKVLRATNGREAVELCSTISKIDLVLMDIKMPVLNGFDATLEIRKTRPELPIIAQTAFSVHEEIEKCEQVGCNDYIIKPIDINLLVKKINRQFLK